MDFYQGVITTIHHLGERLDENVTTEVKDQMGARPGAVVIPMLYDELKRPAMDNIARELTKIDYLNEVVVALTAENEKERDKAIRFFERRGVEATIIWCEDPAILETYEGLRDKGLGLRDYTGKGMAVWTAIGVAESENYAVALHDADVESYYKELPARLLYPIVNPDLDFFFSKGYYSRLSMERMYGRVVRLYVWPLLDAWIHAARDESDFAHYLRGFRYPLAGEFAGTTDLMWNLRVPTDWGIEMGVLGEVYRSASMKRICQVDLGVYSHKHQKMGRGPSEGLQRMVLDLTTTFFRTVTETEASVISKEQLVTLRVLYRRMAQDAIRKYAVDAAANGLDYPRHEEEAAVETFARIIEKAGNHYLRSPGEEQIPDWLRVRSVQEDLPAVIRRSGTVTAMDKTRVVDAGQEAARRT